MSPVTAVVLRDRLPRARPRQADLPGAARGLAREVAQVRPRQGARGAGAPLRPGASLRRPTATSPTGPGWPREGRPGWSRIDLGDRGGPGGGGDDARAARRARRGCRARPGADARQLRHLSARLEGPHLLGRRRARDPRQGGGRGLDPPGDRRGRDRRRRLALVTQGGRLEVSLNLPKAERGRLGAAIEAEIADIARFEGVEATIARLDGSPLRGALA